MSIDMSQFFGVFFEESQEHLEEMEHLLMGISLDAPDPEDLNSIFRAAHSIKGGSGVFGFDALTGLTHVMENILDLARKDELAITKVIVDQLLITVDTLKNILESYQNEDDIDWAAIEKGTVQLEALLKTESGSEQSSTSEDEDGFGFFDVPVQDDDDSFGFFKPIDANDESEEKGFGLFAESVDVDDDSFGFFDDEPTKISASATLESQENDDVIETPKPVPSVTTKSEARTALAGKATVAGKKLAKKAEPKESGSIRVDTMKIDSLVNLVGELVITQSMIKIVGRDVHGEVEEKLEGAIGELSRNIREIQEAVMSMRMLPMSFAFNRFPRVVRDLADKLGKDLELVIEGGATEIDKGMIEKLVDPLTHLIRNSVDHGIEMPNIRAAANKAKVGTVLLNAEQRGSSILITITDDGAGLNRERILEKAMNSGMDVSENMPDEKVWPLIFEAGFSTAEAVTDVSGRGVGMDVVRRNIESIGGGVEIESTAGKGSVFRIRLPLTLAIVDGMCISVTDQTFIIPLTNIIESMQPTKDQIKSIGNDQLLWVREEYWPLVPLHELMGIEGANTDPTSAIVVLVETSRKRFGLLIDALEGQQQVVIKSLEQHYKRIPGVAGATIMGDGGVALILDIESIASVVSIPNQSEVSIVS
ncbi:MAG: two-component system chemotaxis sensor kinase CheA [Glaciecola sp.]|jgi:two-component system chemotaxis sensor kinase CheA